MKLNYRQTILIGFGFLASSVAWSIYNTYVPVLLEQYVAGTFLIGLIMVIYNVCGVIFQPIFGVLSDKTQTRFGRRMPYIMVGLPICALAFALIPFPWSKAVLLVIIIIFSFGMSAWRAPAVALMSDISQPQLRSKANGIINFMGGLGSFLALLAGGLLFKKTGSLPLPFMAGSIVMFLALAVMILFINEEKFIIQTHVEESVQTQGEDIQSPKKGKTRSLILLLFAVFFWFCGTNAVQTFFSLYVTNTLTDPQGQFLTAGDSSLLLAGFALTFLVFSIPAGFIGTKVGRRKTIMIGLIGVAVLFLSILTVKSNMMIMRILLLLGGCFWACVNINSLPMVLELAQWKSIDKYTGYYFFSSISASIISPVLFGWIRDQVGSYGSLFIYAAITFILAFLCMFFVPHGEAQPVKTTVSECMDNLER